MLSLPFDDPLELFPEYRGLTNVEVMIHQQVRKATMGDEKAFNNVLDRVIGKAPQYINQKSVNLSYKDYLKNIVNDEMKNITPQKNEQEDPRNAKLR